MTELEHTMICPSSSKRMSPNNLFINEGSASTPQKTDMCFSTYENRAEKLN